MVPKFRAWDKTENQWIEGFKLHFYEDGSILCLDVEDECDFPFFVENIGLTWELMQSTGLKDKNGVEIFEGDVLTSNVQPCKMVNPIKDGYGVVRFENGMFKLGSISLVTFISKMEVIGNIYENPELLEQAHEI